MIVLSTFEQENLSKTIKWHRKRCKINQQELADIAGIGRASVQRLEKNHSVELDTLLKVLHVLNIKVLLDSPLMNEFAKEIE